MNLKYFFAPKTVAVIGASRKKGKVGNTIFRNLLSYKGKVYPVNVRGKKIFGRKVYRSVLELEDVELAVIAVPPDVVPKVLKECGEAGVEAAIVITGGFSEVGRKDLEEKMRKVVGRMRMIGPNTLGVIDRYSGLDTVFTFSERPGKGNVSVITQSGGVGMKIMEELRKNFIGISKFVSYGNALDVNECDLLEFLGEDEKTGVIAIFIEGARDGMRFLNVARKVSRKKPVVFLKGGKTRRGARAATFHTSSLAGEYKLYSSLLREAGLIEAFTLEELVDYVKVLSKVPIPKGNDVAIVTNGGGLGVLASDECERQGIKLRKPNKGIRSVRKEMPSHVVLENPFDVTGDADDERFLKIMSFCSEHYDCIILMFLELPSLSKDFGKKIVRFWKRKKIPLVCCTNGKSASLLEKAGIPTYPTPERAVKAVKVLLEYKNLSR
ncbi:MAG: acetate--CoA ligase family protein [Candidatus Syntropharchaeia archaeon]